ncbi:MAG: bifunctional folylpolyglutamate synthase/dihydrofolate synthase [Thermomicrobiales bacterium]
MSSTVATHEPPRTRTPGEILRRYREALAKTDALIERTPAAEGKSLAEVRQRAEMRLARLRRFLAYLGNPHLRYPVVHVGGTSGKGSTSTAVAAILTAAGYRTGLHTSPYLQAATEKLQFDGRLIAGDRFADLIDDLLATADAWAARKDEGSLTYGEFWVALTAVAFAQEPVDMAVIEVGAGGRFDMTNVVQPAVSVVTSIGLDHTVTLGPTVEQIAWHKAGIVKASAPVVTAVADPTGLRPILAEAAATGATVTRVVPGATFEILTEDADGVTWHEVDAQGIPGPTLTTALPGRFQATNAATAVAAVRALAAQGFAVPFDAIREGLAHARIPGRCEVVQASPRVILDGAHNPDKVAALVAELPRLAARPAGGHLIAVVGMLESKEHQAMLRLIAPAVDELVLTTPRVLAKPGTPVDLLAAEARAVGFGGTAIASDVPRSALEQALGRAQANRGDVVLVTGSLYLVGNLRPRWYPDDAVLLQQTPWPRPSPSQIGVNRDATG